MRQKRKLEELRSVSTTDISGRLELAEALFEAGQIDEAIAQCVWLWKHLLEVEPHWSSRRNVRLVQLLRRFQDANPSVCDAIDRLRARARLADWVTLSAARGLEDDVIERVRAERKRRKLGDKLEQHIVQMLESHGTPRMLGMLVRAPLKVLKAEKARMTTILTDVPEDVSAKTWSETRAFFARRLTQKRALYEEAMRIAGRAGTAALVGVFDVRLPTARR